MGISISGSNAISGLSGNDTDFDKVLTQLKQIESTQLNRLEAWKSDWNLRYEAFGKIIEQIQAASSMLSQLSDKNSFVTKSVQSSNSNVITAVANASAQDVQHTIKVNQMASNAIWANSGYVFESKDERINITGEDQFFNYIYAGKKYEFKVPANTSLDSFVSMINNSATNPGIKVSLIQTGKGYVFQVAGKDTGVKNDLVILNSKLVGMEATDSTKSTWQTNSVVDPDKEITNPTNFVFDIVLQGGSKKTVTIPGDTSLENIKIKLNSIGGIKAEYDADGNWTLKGVQSFSFRKESKDEYVPPKLAINCPNGLDIALNKTGGLAEGMGDDDILSFEMELDDGSTREVKIKASATKSQLFDALAMASPDGSGKATLEGALELSGVKSLAVTTAVPHSGRLTTTKTDPKGVLNRAGSTLEEATTKITFAKENLTQNLDVPQDGSSLVFTVVKKDGTAVNLDAIKVKPDMTNQELVDKIKEALADKSITANYTTPTDKDPYASLTLDDVKEFRLSGGSMNKKGWETKLESTVKIPAAGDASGNKLYGDSANKLLEKAPDLVYTITTNDGKIGTLTLNSGASMKQIMTALQDPSNTALWKWEKIDGKNADKTDKLVPDTPPSNTDWNVKFIDEAGNEYTDPAALNGKKVFLNMQNVQAATGPGIAGQVKTSSNWNIKQSANARFTVDNWPLEVETDSNKVSDVIEGVVFTIQGTNKENESVSLSVSTDITSVEKSIQNFLDAVNSVLMTVNELMKYDKNKEVTSNDPNDKGNDNYSSSGLTNQKGNLLTGNYGVQLFKSRFSSLLGSNPPGFKSVQSATDVLSGDILASLANMGIKVDTDTTSDTYGLLVMAPNSTIAELQNMDKENYSNMITNHLDAVVDFFCTSGTGSSTSTQFRYGSHVAGITKGGSYEVTYEVTDNGDIINVKVGGQPAKRDDTQPGNYFSVATGDPKGIAILIDDVSLGKHPEDGKEPMYVRIKQGLVQTANSFLKDELIYNDINISANSTPQQIADAVALKSKNGALMSLRANYKTVMEGIDAKIEREQRRLSTWESRQKKIFANLETLLKSYSDQQKQLESQLGQLGGSSSK